MKKIILKTIISLFSLLVFFSVLSTANAQENSITITPTINDISEQKYDFSWTSIPKTKTYTVVIDGKSSSSITNSVTVKLPLGNHTVSVSAIDSSGKVIATSGDIVFEVNSVGIVKKNRSADLPDAVGSIQGLNLPKSNFNNLGDLTTGVANWLLGIGGALATIAVVYSGIMYMTAANTVVAKGDVGKVEKAKKNLTWAIIGVVVAILAIIIVNEIPKILGG